MSHGLVLAALNSSSVERQLEKNGSRAFRSMAMINVSRQTDLSTVDVVHDACLLPSFARWFYLQAQVQMGLKPICLANEAVSIKIEL